MLIENHNHIGALGVMWIAADAVLTGIYALRLLLQLNRLKCSTMDEERDNKGVVYRFEWMNEGELAFELWRAWWRRLGLRISSDNVRLHFTLLRSTEKTDLRHTGNAY